MKKYAGFLQLISPLLTVSLTFSSGFAPSVKAAENVMLAVGPIQQSVKVKDLEQYVNTGDLSSNLQAYEFFLTPQLRQALKTNLHVDASLADKFIEYLFNSTEGEKLIRQLNGAFPGATPEKLKSTFSSTVDNNDAVSVLNFIKAYPEDNLKVDLTATANIAFQLNASFLESNMIAPVLESDLKVETVFNPIYNLNPTAPTEAKVYRHSYIVQDTTRNRRIPFDVYYSEKTQGPLVVMSHGFGADRRFLGYLAHHLSSHGFTVVSIEHPGSNVASLRENAQGMDINNLLPASEFIDRPKDISFLLDQLATINEQKGYLKGKFNANQVTVIGHSFGGYTAIALAGADVDIKQLREYCQSLSPFGRSPADWLQCAAAKLLQDKLSLQDNRVAQVIAFNPIVGKLFGDNLPQLKIPVLILASTEDGITPIVPHQLKPFGQISGKKYLVTAIGATHLSVTDIKNLQATLGTNTLVREVLSDDSQPLQEAAKALTLAFVSQLTPQAEQYQEFLTPGYVQSFSTPAMKLRFNKQLPLSVNAWLNVLNYGTQKIVLQTLPEEPNPPQEDNIASSFLSAIDSLFGTRQEVSPESLSCIAPLEGIFFDLLEDYESPSG